MLEIPRYNSVATAYYGGGYVLAIIEAFLSKYAKIDETACHFDATRVNIDNRVFYFGNFPPHKRPFRLITIVNFIENDI
jgi:hypothetical protein